MGDDVSAVMTESVNTGEIVSVLTPSTAMIPTVVVESSWMAPTVAVCGFVGVCLSIGVTTAATPSTWVTYVIAALSRNHTNEERQSC
jgi:hypothetical protein